MMVRRRKIPSKEEKPQSDSRHTEGLPATGEGCAVEIETLEGGHRICGFKMHRRPNGDLICRVGHVTPAKVLEPEDGPEAVQFEAREGDILVIAYAGSKLSIAPYSTVELDGATYSRRLLPGEDPEEEWAKVYGFLKQRCESVAREKLSTYAAELAKAKAKASGEDY